MSSGSGPVTSGVTGSTASYPERPTAYNSLTSLRSSAGPGVRNSRPSRHFPRRLVQPWSKARPRPLKALKPAPTALLNVREAAAGLSQSVHSVRALRRREAAVRPCLQGPPHCDGGRRVFLGHGRRGKKSTAGVATAVHDSCRGWSLRLAGVSLSVSQPPTGFRFSYLPPNRGCVAPSFSPGSMAEIRPKWFMARI
jgi:hypothetical protein